MAGRKWSVASNFGASRLPNVPGSQQSCQPLAHGLDERFRLGQAPPQAIKGFSGSGKARHAETGQRQDRTPNHGMLVQPAAEVGCQRVGTIMCQMYSP